MIMLPKLQKKLIMNNLTLQEAAIKSGFVTKEQFDKWVRPEDIVVPS